MGVEKMRIAWTTDIHLDHTGREAKKLFLDEVVRSGADALLITGDLSGGHTLMSHLDWLGRQLQVPIWFVLGNHDYYGNGMSNVRDKVRTWIAENHDAQHRWLGDSDCEAIVPQGLRTAVVGADGWYDTRFGKVDGSVALNDFFYISDLRPFFGGRGPAPSSPLLPELRRIADAETCDLERKLDKVLALSVDRILVATHVPPFADAAWHQGSRSEPNYLPFFSCRSMGEMIVSKAEKHPDKEFLVLCGHTHGSGIFRPTPRIKVVTGGAVYGRPALCGMIKI